MDCNGTRQRPGAFSDNLTSSMSYYADPDGVTRPAAGAYNSGVAGRPLATNNAPSRPIILNRPFRSVGDLGYVFRDLPWKNLDFATTSSADAALLDLFSITDSETVAGKINLNTSEPLALEAMLVGTVKNIEDSATVNQPDAETIAEAVIDFTSTNGPLQNKSELITKLSDAISFAATDDNAILGRREAWIRALGEVGQTRTWNLMIDLVSQSGINNPSGDFVVQGEKRYWLHLAIDRYTGETVGQILEPVYE